MNPLVENLVKKCGGLSFVFSLFSERRICGACFCTRMENTVDLFLVVRPFSLFFSVFCDS